ncbi:MAG: amidase family protein, partial [Dehalococcoidia bacterium]
MTAPPIPLGDRAIIAASATDLAYGIAEGRLSARGVVDAHIRRIEATHAGLNAVVTSLFDEARRAAVAADAARARGEALGPLH